MTKTNEWIHGKLCVLVKFRSGVFTNDKKLHHQIVLSLRCFISSKCIKYYLRTEVMVQCETKLIVLDQYLVSSRYESLECYETSILFDTVIDTKIFLEPIDKCGCNLICKMVSVAALTFVNLLCALGFIKMKMDLAYGKMWDFVSGEIVLDPSRLYTYVRILFHICTRRRVK